MRSAQALQPHQRVQSVARAPAWRCPDAHVDLLNKEPHARRIAATQYHARVAAQRPRSDARDRTRQARVAADGAANPATATGNTEGGQPLADPTERARVVGGNATPTPKLGAWRAMAIDDGQMSPLEPDHYSLRMRQAARPNPPDVASGMAWRKPLCSAYYLYCTPPRATVRAAQSITLSHKNL